MSKKGGRRRSFIADISQDEILYNVRERRGHIPPIEQGVQAHVAYSYRFESDDSDNTILSCV